jgi:ribosomal protein S18 acetylase RimI-like enzyme
LGFWSAATQICADNEDECKQVVRIDPASASAVAALENDPFYRSICAAYVCDVVRYRAVLTQYFDYSIQEGRDIGRCVHPADCTRGVAVWLLPRPSDMQSRAAHNKLVFLDTTLGPEGCATYFRIVNFMSTEAANIVDDHAWYLSIVAVDPTSQGRGLGRKLLELTIAEADRVLATCYVETFSSRNIPFYERLGFVTKARSTEPTTRANYIVMVRSPRAGTFR